MDEVHAWVVYRREVTRTPVRALAAEIGVSKSAVDEFHKRKLYPGKIWPRLRDWYLRDRKMRHEDYRTPPDEMVWGLVRSFDSVPAKDRAAGVRKMAEFYRDFFAQRKVPCPDWVEMLAASAETESEPGSPRDTGKPAPEN